MRIYHGKLNPPANGYTHVLYAATPERLDGYYWYRFRRDCTGGGGGGTWGFLPWNGGPQQGGSLFDQLLPEWEDEMKSQFACHWDYSVEMESYEEMESYDYWPLYEDHELPAAEGVAEVLSNLRAWQAQQP